jgi:predicted RNA-binding protein with PIN domain
MSLHYILDGYNIIQSGPDELLARGTLQGKREFLLGLLKAFLNNGAAGMQVTVVFDGPESLPFFGSEPSSSYYYGIRVVFSEGRTADARIEELVGKLTNAGETIVVTNDRGLRRIIATSGVRFMSVDEFVKKILPEKSRGKQGRPDEVEISMAESINSELKDIWLKHK